MAEQESLGPSLGWIREKVEHGSYCISEHVLRLITSGIISVADMEGVLSTGLIAEFRKNGQNRMASLVRGNSSDGSVSFLCTRMDDGPLCVLLGYLDPVPQWEEQGMDRKENFVEQKKRRCFFCGESIQPIVIGNFDYRLEGELFVVKKVPAGLCLGCGEKYIESDVAREINKKVGEGSYETTDLVRVVEYGRG